MSQASFRQPSLLNRMLVRNPQVDSVTQGTGRARPRLASGRECVSETPGARNPNEKEFRAPGSRICYIRFSSEPNRLGKQDNQGL